MTGHHHRPGLLARGDAWLIRTSAVAWLNLRAVLAVPAVARAERRKTREDRERAERQARDAQTWTLAEARNPATDSTVPLADLALVQAHRDYPPASEERLILPGVREYHPDGPEAALEAAGAGVVLGAEPQPEPEPEDWEQAQTADLDRYLADRTAEHMRWMDWMHVATLGHADEQVAA